MIADQLYLLPFVRRYAAFLGLDPDETALRFVHEVQHAEGTPIRTIEPMATAPAPIFLAAQSGAFDCRWRPGSGGGAFLLP